MDRMKNGYVGMLRGAEHRLVPKVEILSLDPPKRETKQSVADFIPTPFVETRSNQLGYYETAPMSTIFPVAHEPSGKTLVFYTKEIMHNYYSTVYIRGMAGTVGVGYTVSDDNGLTWDANDAYRTPNMKLPTIPFDPDRNIQRAFKYEVRCSGYEFYLFYSFGFNDEVVGDLEDWEEGYVEPRREVRVKRMLFDPSSNMFTEVSDRLLYKEGKIFTTHVDSFGNVYLYVATEGTVVTISKYFPAEADDYLMPVKVFDSNVEIRDMHAVAKNGVPYLAVVSLDDARTTGGQTTFFRCENADPGKKWSFVSTANYIAHGFGYDWGRNQFTLETYGPEGYTHVVSTDNCKYFLRAEVYGTGAMLRTLSRKIMPITLPNGEYRVFFLALRNSVGARMEDPFRRKTSVVSEQYLCEIPTSKILDFEFESVIADGVSRRATVTLSNVDNFFELSEKDPLTGFGYRNIFFGSLPGKDYRSLAPRVIRLKIGEDAIENEDEKYETVFTGIIVNSTWDSTQQTVTVECQDYLYLLANATRLNTYSSGLSNANRLLTDLFFEAGLVKFQIERDPEQFDIEYAVFEPESTYLDNIMEILEYTKQRLYCDRFGVVRTISYAKRTDVDYYITPDDIFTLTRRGPTAEQAVNTVKINVGSDMDGNPVEIMRMNPDALDAMRRPVMSSISFGTYFERTDGEIEGRIRTLDNAGRLADSILSDLSRPTTYLFLNMKMYMFLEAHDIVQVIFPNPLVDGRFRVKSFNCKVDFSNEDVGYDFTCELIDAM